MTDDGPVLSARQVDDLRRWLRDPEQLDPVARDGLVSAGVLRGDVVDASVVAAVSVLERSWASYRLRRWRHGDRADLVGAVGPGGVALLSGGPGVDAPLRIDHRPRWTGLPRALAGFVGLGPSAADGLPARVEWDDLVAATGDAPPAWLPAVGDGPPPTLWDLRWQPSSGRPSRRLTVLDVAHALVEVRPTDDGAATMELVACRPEDVWLGLCHLVADLVPRDRVSG